MEHTYNMWVSAEKHSGERIVIITFMVYVRIWLWKHMLNSEDWNGPDTSARWLNQEHQGISWKERYIW